MKDFLEPERVQLETAPDGTLRAVLQDERCARNVQVLRAFPLSSPDEHIVLRDGGGKELGVLEKLTLVDENNRALLKKALDSRYFLPRIIKINALSERFAAAVWDVETDRGPIVINTKSLLDSLSELGGGRYLLRDVEENRYEIRDVDQMDTTSQLLFAGKF